MTNERTEDQPESRAMLPLALDLSSLATGLIGAGAPVLARFRLLAACGATPSVFAPGPDTALHAAAAGRLTARLPTGDEIARLRVLFVAGLPAAQSTRLAAAAREARVLVNVEDMPALCDFHVPAIVRRGDLVVSVSTGGRSPTLARRLRAHIEELLPEIWASRLEQAALLRRSLRSAGAAPTEVAKAVDALIDSEGWVRPRK